MSNKRAGHTSTLLSNGQVLVTGGDDDVAHSTAELYDPLTGAWTFIGSLPGIPCVHTASILPNGKVLVVGGYICHKIQEINQFSFAYERNE